MDQPVDLSFGRTVNGHVDGSAVETIAREVVELWKALEPDEVARWKADVAERKKNLLHTRGSKVGFTKDENLSHTMSVPMFVALTMGRRLGDPHWLQNDYKAKEAFLRALPEARFSNTKSQRCDGDG